MSHPVTLTSLMEAFVDGMAAAGPGRRPPGSPRGDHTVSRGSATPDERSMPRQRLAERKARLRKELLAARTRLSVAERKAAGRALRDAVLGLPEMGMAGTVAAYLSVG